MSHSSHEHRRGLIGNILDFVEDEDEMKTNKSQVDSQPQSKEHMDTMVCGNCKAVIPAHSKFCPECGYKLSDAQHCTNCGEELPPNAKFCLKCGQKVGQ